MFQWLSRFTTSGNRLSKATAALADTFEQLNQLVREQTGLDRLSVRRNAADGLDAKAAGKPARLTRKAKAEVIDHKPQDTTGAA